MSSTIILLAIVATSAYVLAVRPCDNGWRYFPVTNACYKLIDDELPWTVGELKCLFQGAHQTSIENAAENQFVHELSRRGEMWIGAAFFETASTYVNSDHKAYGRYTNWKGGLTPPLHRGRRCIKIDRNGQWFQSCCKKKSLTVCKKPSATYSWEMTNDVSEFRRMKFRRI